jgi:hypothetical protein
MLSLAIRVPPRRINEIILGRCAISVSDGVLFSACRPIMI